MHAMVKQTLSKPVKVVLVPYSSEAPKLLGGNKAPSTASVIETKARRNYLPDEKATHTSASVTVTSAGSKGLSSATHVTQSKQGALLPVKKRVSGMDSKRSGIIAYGLSHKTKVTLEEETDEFRVPSSPVRPHDSLAEADRPRSRGRPRKSYRSITIQKHVQTSRLGVIPRARRSKVDALSGLDSDSEVFRSKTTPATDRRTTRSSHNFGPLLELDQSKKGGPVSQRENRPELRSEIVGGDETQDNSFVSVPTESVYRKSDATKQDRQDQGGESLDDFVASMTNPDNCEKFKFGAIASKPEVDLPLVEPSQMARNNCKKPSSTRNKYEVVSQMVGLQQCGAAGVDIDCLVAERDVCQSASRAQMVSEQTCA